MRVGQIGLMQYREVSDGTRLWVELSGTELKED